MAHLIPRILCVGDDPAIREHLAHQLRRFGIQPVLVSAGIDALCIAKTEEVDVCVINSRMPDMNGEKLARELRRVAPQIPLVMTSADGRARHAVSKLVDRFVAKDAGYERALVSEVFSLLGGRSRAVSG